MRFLVDECAGPRLAAWLRAHGHDICSVYDEARGLEDEQVILKAFAEDRIIITTDKGFGERVYREGYQHCGVILLRLGNERATVKIAAVQRLLAAYADRLPGRYVVVTEARIRFARK